MGSPLGAANYYSLPQGSTSKSRLGNTAFGEIYITA